MSTVRVPSILLAMTIVLAVAGPLDADTQSTRTMQLRYCPAAQATKTLQQALAGQPVTIAADERTNKLILTGSSDSINKAQFLIQSLDLPLARLALEVVLETGSEGKPEPVWKGTLSLTSGETSKIDLKGGTTLAASEAAGKVTGLKGAFKASVNPDNYCRVEALLAATLTSSSGNTTSKFSGQVQVRDGETTTVTVLEIGSGKKMRLRVTPRVQKFGSPGADTF